MKKLDFGIGVLTLLLVCLSWGVIERKAVALTCLDLSGCCGAAGCSGPGTVNGCSIECAGGGSVKCAVVGSDGKCGGPLSPITPQPRPE